MKHLMKGPWTSVGGCVYDQTGFPLAHISGQQSERAKIAAKIAELPTLVVKLRAELRSYIRDQYEGTSELKARLKAIP